MEHLPTAEAVPDPESTLQDASEHLRVERRKLVDEQYAFDQFRSELETLSPAKPVQHEFEWAMAEGPTGTDRVCDAYRSTVMTVPHYDEEYDDPLGRSMASEFNKDIAAAVTGNDRLGPELKRSVLELTTEAIERRELLVQMIDEELDSLKRCLGALGEIRERTLSLLNQPVDNLEYNSLQSTRDRLYGIIEDCEALATRRQSDLRDHTRQSLIDIGDVSEYLYSDRAIIHPVLSDVTSMLSVLDRTVSYVERTLARAS